VTKPFYPEELLARVQARLRRRAGTSAIESIDVGPLQIRPEHREVFLHEVALDLTRAELEILLHLGKRLGHAVSRAELAELALDREDDLSGERALDVHMSRIRKKLGKESSLIATVWGIGYRLSKPSKP
jgi:DNA-binding response OmpR family regulator